MYVLNDWFFHFTFPARGGDLNVPHRSFNIGNYVCDNRTEGEILIWRSCLINQDEFSLFLFVLFTIFYAQKDEKGFIRDLWLRPKLICDTWILQKGELDSWIYEPAWGVICLLKYTWPMIVFSKLVKTSWFPWKLSYKKKDLKFPFHLRDAWIFPIILLEMKSASAPSPPPTSHFPSLLTWLIKASTFGNGPQR